MIQKIVCLNGVKMHAGFTRFFTPRVLHTSCMGINLRSPLNRTQVVLYFLNTQYALYFRVFDSEPNERVDILFKRYYI